MEVNCLNRKILIVTIFLGVMLTLPTIVSASDAFLCPVLGTGKDGTKGVVNADTKNGPNRGIDVINPPVGASQLPGKNQAGAHANSHAYNTKGPGDPTAGPGHNPNFSPIWPPA